MKALLILIALLCAALAQSVGCARGGAGGEDGVLLVAAATSLTDAFEEVGRRYTQKTGVRVTLSFGATGDLARQIENGAPFDVFASADAAHVERLQTKGLLAPESRAPFARGKLVLWFPPGSRARLTSLDELASSPEVTRLAVARPEVAPYGRAAVEALKSENLWERVEPKVVYSQTVAQAKQFAATGNADAAFIPRALVREGEGRSVEVGEDLHGPVEHVVAALRSSERQRDAQAFVEFVLGEEGQAILETYGYGRR